LAADFLVVVFFAAAFLAGAFFAAAFLAGAFFASVFFVTSIPDSITSVLPSGVETVFLLDFFFYFTHIFCNTAA